MFPDWIGFSVLAGLVYAVSAESSDAKLLRRKRQGLGAFSQARTTNSPFIDTDESSGVALQLDALKITSAPAVDDSFGPAAQSSVPSTTILPAGTPAKAPGAPIKAPGGPVPPTVTQAPAGPPTTFSGYLVGSPYPFALPPPDIPYFGSKWNGPWGYPIGHYQAFRGTGQYVNHYQYYPLSYYGSLMAPLRYAVSGNATSEATRTRHVRPRQDNHAPFVDTNLAAGINLDLDRLGLTSAPAQDNLFNSFVLPMTTPIPVALGESPPVSTTTMRPMTTFPGYLVGSRICSLSSRSTRHISARNGTVLGGHYQAFRGTEQYANHYHYYPLSYFGWFMTRFS
ncbi:hypothetical protein BV898_12415 [Hypsibius exemplaris]|uniref:Uncharacterized protein n=1 Tax=Hypsibius exemplaris TaxID=2072580 RepID=A0A1W0WDY6_HYPEX|nr:hypothetical protein BV898_12415 [Hypsibius exemplaris]